HFLDKMPTYGPYKGVTVKCLYQIDSGGALPIAHKPLDPQQRPQWFTGEGVEGETYKRVREPPTAPRVNGVADRRNSLEGRPGPGGHGGRVLLPAGDHLLNLGLG